MQAQLTGLAQRFVDESAADDPIMASSLGLAAYDGRLAIPSEARRTDRIARLHAWKIELATISAGAPPNATQAVRGDVVLLHDGADRVGVDRAWNAIVARLEQAPAFVLEGQKRVTAPGRLFGIVGAQRLAGTPDFLGGALTDAAAAQWAGDADKGQRFIRARDALLTTLAETRAFIEIHAPAWPENFAIGKPAYEQMLHDDLLLPYGAASGGGMAPSGPPLVGDYRDRIAELTAFVKAHDVVTVPAWLGAMEIVETPAFLQPVSPGASMRSPRLFARRHPDLVRRIQHDAAFAEGWAFYGEEMFVRLGLYGDDLDARLFTARWERVRGARAIVDPKLASGEWTVEQAVDFFEQQSGFTRDASRAAVQGIATGPGYVIAYTVGRLQLQTLLGDYLRRAGESGSLRDFHDRLLSYGSIPFSVLGAELLADLDKSSSAVRAAANY